VARFKALRLPITLVPYGIPCTHLLFSGLYYDCVIIFLLFLGASRPTTHSDQDPRGGIAGSIMEITITTKLLSTRRGPPFILFFLSDCTGQVIVGATLKTFNLVLQNDFAARVS
jgi:hypothetical protein